MPNLAANLTSLVVLTGLVVIFGSLAYGALSAAPWVPIRRKDIKRLLEFGGVGPNQKLYDLGCGDGRIVAEAAKLGAQASGFEIALLPFWLARLRLLLARKRSGQIYLKNFWHVNFNQADVIVCFLTPQAMQKLERKIAYELKPGAKFLSYAFRLPNRMPARVSKPQPHDVPIYLYT